MSGLIRFEGAEYKVCGDGRCLISYITEDCDHFRVPSVISTSEGKRYRVTGISSPGFLERGCANIISFDESSEVREVPVSFIGHCKSTFILPRNVKRVTSSCPLNFPNIASENGFQRFVSTSGSRVIMDHFPLEVAYQHSRRKRFIIRETVRFVGDFSFCLNKSITSVVFPSSVEYIGNLSFCGCKNLRFILFMKNSKLKIIGYRSFVSTSLESIEIPANVEEISECAFSDCKNLRSVSYINEAKIRRIDKRAFDNCPNLTH